MPAYCAVPDVVEQTSRDPNPQVFTLSPPSATGEVCDTSVKTVVTTGGTEPMSSTTEVQGPPGPIGPQGPAAPHDGVKWAGDWAEGVEYKANNKDTPQHADMVRIDGAVFVCIEDHTSDSWNMPRFSNDNAISTWREKWQMVIEAGTAEQKSFIEDLYDGVFDWMKTATVGDWVKAIAIGAGIIWAGTKILEAFTDNGGDGSDDSRYTGSPSYFGPYTAPSVRTVVESLCLNAGITSYDVSLLSNTTSCHFALGQVTSIRTILDNMSKTFQFDMVDSGGVLKFVPRNSTIVRTLTHEDMGFNTSGDTVAPVTMKRLQSVDLPRSVTLTYIAEDLDYNNYSQKSEISTFSAGNDVSLQVPFMLTHADAKSSVDKLLIGAHLERMQYTFKTSYANAIDLEPGDVISIPEGYVRIVSIEESDEGILEIHAVDAGAVGAPQPIIVGGVTIGYTASTYIGTGQDPQLPSAVINAASTVTKSGCFFIDPPVMDSADKEPRVYAAVHGYGVQGWPGAQIFKSVDGGASYTLVGQQTISATWGLVGTAIAEHTHYLWDDTSVITVQLKTGTLVSKTDAAVLAGENLCMVGQECIAFGTATLVGTNTYQLTHLLRGRRGTEFAINDHTTNELFVMLDGGLLELPVANSDRGKTFKYKVVTIGSDLTKVDEQNVQIIGNNTIPWEPAKLTGSKNGTSQFTINWIPRPRYNNGLLDYYEISNDYDFGGYAVVIYNGVNIVRQEIVYNTSYVYSEAKQVADFGSVQTNLKVGVIQISNLFGGGRSAFINI